jgi:hypothetical protein
MNLFTIGYCHPGCSYSLAGPDSALIKRKNDDNDALFFPCQPFTCLLSLLDSFGCLVLTGCCYYCRYRCLRIGYFTLKILDLNYIFFCSISYLFYRLFLTMAQPITHECIVDGWFREKSVLWPGQGK